MVKNSRGINLIFILLLGALLVMVWTSSLNQVQDNYTVGALQQDLEEGLVTGAVIGQNRETPTGSVTVSLSDGRSRTAYVTNVEDAIDLLEQYDIDPLVRDVPQESWFMNYMLPVLVMAAVIMIFFFMMMNAQNAGAGASGNKMMNFGKSRARMSTGKDNRITLKDVAGLKEEKEDLEEIIDFLREPSKYTKVPRPLRERQTCRFSAFPVLISWKCSSVSAPPVCATCLRMQRRIRPVSCSSTRSTPWQDAAERVWAAAMMRGSRP